VWSAESQSQEPTLLHTLRGHSRAVEDMAVDYSTSGKGNIVVYTASSDRTVRRWNVSRERAFEETEPFIIHETSVYSIKVDQEDMWTCTFRVSWDANCEARRIRQLSDMIEQVILRKSSNIPILSKTLLFLEDSHIPLAATRIYVSGL